MTEIFLKGDILLYAEKKNWRVAMFTISQQVDEANPPATRLVGSACLYSFHPSTVIIPTPNSTWPRHTSLDRYNFQHSHSDCVSLNLHITDNVVRNNPIVNKSS